MPTKTLFPNHTLHRINEGQLALGMGIYHLRSAATPLLAQACGFDWLFILGEHGSYTNQEIAQLCMAALPSGITPIVQIPKFAFDEGSRALDNGAQGLIIPHIDTPEEAKSAVDAFLYPPLGRRSWGGPPVIYRYNPPSLGEAQTEINRNILLTVMLESPQAISNADAIAAIDGINVLFVGAADLSAELGVPGEVGHERVADAINTVALACKRHGKILGLGGVYDLALQERYIKLGARFVLSGSDQAYLIAAGSKRAAELRALI